MKNWYIRNNDEHLRPYSLDELRLVGLYSDDYVWKEGFSAWTKASAVDELKGILITVEHSFFSPETNVMNQSSPLPSDKKEKSSVFTTIFSSLKKVFVY